MELLVAFVNSNPKERRREKNPTPKIPIPESIKVSFMDGRGRFLESVIKNGRVVNNATRNLRKATRNGLTLLIRRLFVAG
jgi:hypothetical protein